MGRDRGRWHSHSRIERAGRPGIALGDYLIVHAGFAIARLDVEDAEKTLALFDEIAAHLRRSLPMRYIRGFRDGAAATALARLLAAEVDPEREYHLMEFCGGHTHAIFRYGVEDLLPTNVRLVHGPGCPVCVLAVPRLDAAIELARQPNVTLVSYGDMLRVPASRRRSLLKARAGGADVRMAYSAFEALEIAGAHPERQAVFFAIGFETTTPATAHIILEARRLQAFAILLSIATMS
jgi:hydrogenase expression/formation protein HypD